jgi:hypothetical protein
MNKANKRRRIARLAAYMMVGAFLMQLGPCMVMGLSNATAAFNFSSLLDQNGYFLGIFAMCGRPNVQQVDANGVPSGGILYTEDDLLVDCPFTTQVVP